MKYFYAILLGFFLTFLSFAENEKDLQELLNKYNFTQVIQILENEDFSELSLESRYIFIESLARNGEGFRAIPYLNILINSIDRDDALLTLCGIVFHSIGDLDNALEFFRLALTINPENTKALYSKSMLLLYFRRFKEAKKLYEIAGEIDKDLSNNYLYLLMGNRIYHAIRDIENMKSNFIKIRNYFNKQENQEKVADYQVRIDMLNKYNEATFFTISADKDKIELPIYDFAEDVPYKCLHFQIENKEYKILLDTGNAPGWTIHEPELIDKIPHILGGSGRIYTGSVEHDLESRYLITSNISLSGLSISNLIGYYFEKPRDDYIDANLNPIYIRDRVVSIDYINNNFILWTKEAFDKYISKLPAYTVSKMTYFGWEWPFVPIRVNNYASGLTMIETGAEDVSPSLEFAKFINMPLEPSVFEFRGKEYPTHISELNLLLGSLQMHREEAYIWPRRFYDTITGLFHHIMIGPLALEGEYIVHFDPFDNKIIFQIHKKEQK